mmetsp:Transcript_26875/g.80253  ORF Transcript_26875/g.80253 Transcript_26875/m.80253 type:complete len:328 (-) Transcript_26875:336-1319(-)
MGKGDGVSPRRREEPAAREDGDQHGERAPHLRGPAKVPRPARARQGGQPEPHPQVRHLCAARTARERRGCGLRRRHEGAPQLLASHAPLPRGGPAHRAGADAAALLQRRPHRRHLQPPELHLLLWSADGPRRLARDRLLRHQLLCPCFRARGRRLVSHRVDHRGLSALAQGDRLRVALPLPRPRPGHGGGAGGLAPDLQAALALVHRLFPGLLPGGDLHVGAAAAQYPDALLLQLDHGLPLDHHLLPRLFRGSDRVGLHEDPSRQGAHHTAHAPLGRLLRLDGGGHRDDATQLQPLLRLPRLQGQLHHVVVLPQGDVEGGAWPPRAA